MSDSSPGRGFLQGVIFIIVATQICHVLYSPLGFNPSDEGYMLSGSRRLLDGQIPHRDYISLRPVGTHLLHAHLLAWAGDSLLLWSRFTGWFQLALVAWLWVLISERHLGFLLGMSKRFAIAGIGLLFSAHTFPIMPWNTIDGIFFLSIGVYLMTSSADEPARGIGIAAGALLIGITPLFRQNFILFAPLLAVASSRQSYLRHLALTLVPTIGYVLFLFINGALDDALAQMTGTAFDPGFLVPFLVKPKAIAIICLSAALSAIGVIHGRRYPNSGAMILGLCVMFSAATLHLKGEAAWLYSWAAFGTLSGTVIAGAWRWRLASILILTAWTAAISIGYPTPALATAALVAPALALATRTLTGAAHRHLFLFAILFVTMVSFNRGRLESIYMQPPARFLTMRLDGILKGGRGVKTDSQTYQHFLELDGIIARARESGRPYIVIPEAAQFWATSVQPNPLSSDWCINGEIAIPALRARCLREIDACDSGTVFVVQKYASYTIPKEPSKRILRPSVLADRIAEEYPMVEETEFWKVFGSFDPDEMNQPDAS